MGPTQPVPTAPRATAATAPVAAAVAPSAPAASGPIGSKTIPLAKIPGSAGGPRPPVGRVTTPLQAGGPTHPAQQGYASSETIPLNQPLPSTVKIEEPEEDWEEEPKDPGLMPFAIIVLILSLAVLAIELLTKLGSS